MQASAQGSGGRSMALGTLGLGFRVKRIVAVSNVASIIRMEVLEGGYMGDCIASILGLKAILGV